MLRNTGRRRLYSYLKEHGLCQCIRVKNSTYCRRGFFYELKMKQKGVGLTTEEKVSLHSQRSSLFLHVVLWSLFNITVFITCNSAASCWQAEFVTEVYRDQKLLWLLFLFFTFFFFFLSFSKVNTHCTGLWANVGSWSYFQKNQWWSSTCMHRGRVVPFFLFQTVWKGSFFKSLGLGKKIVF